MTLFGKGIPKNIVVPNKVKISFWTLFGKVMPKSRGRQGGGVFGITLCHSLSRGADKRVAIPWEAGAPAPAGFS